MTPQLRRLLLLPVLAPLVAVAALALLNPSPPVALRLLTWTTPALPIGSWLAIAVGGGGLLSAAATTAALQTPLPGRRRVRVRTSSSPEAPAATAAPASAGPQRPPGAPAPTVEVPFRVIRQGSASTKPEDKAPARAPGSAPAPTNPVANAVGDGWSSSANDDW